MERPTLVRLLVVVAIGVPILIEATTFAGLFESRVLGGGSGTVTETPTPSEDAVGVGEELLPATPQAETVREAEVRTEAGDRHFRLTVEVRNTDAGNYSLRLDALTTESGTTIPEGGGSVEVGPGEEGTLDADWPLPERDGPAAVIVIATVPSTEGGHETVTRRRSIVSSSPSAVNWKQ